MNLKKSITVVAPVYNESEVIKDFIEELSVKLFSISENFEIILVDDGSNDDSYMKIIQLSLTNSRVTALRLSRNFGQHAAIMAGLMRANGEIIVVMDSDLQDNPAAIQDLVRELDRGFDVVFVNRVNRKTNRVYLFLQIIFYRILTKVSNLTFDPGLGNFSIITRKVLDKYLDLNGSIPFYPAAIKWLGFKSSKIDYPVRARPEGSKSKYNFLSRIRLAFSVIISHSARPLRFAVVIGGLMAFMGLALSTITLWAHFQQGFSQPGWASIIIAILFFSGLQLSFTGIVGLYIAEIVKVTQGRPLFVVSEETEP